MSVVLKGGGSTSVAYMGAIEAMRDMNVKPTTVMGTSTGAMFGFFMATQVPLKELKAMIYGEEGPLGDFGEIFDSIEAPERKKQFDANIQKIMSKAKGSSHITNAIHVSVWSLLTLVTTFDWFSHSADVMTEAIING